MGSGKKGACSDSDGRRRKVAKGKKETSLNGVSKMASASAALNGKDNDETTMKCRAVLPPPIGGSLSVSSGSSKRTAMTLRSRRAYKDLIYVIDDFLTVEECQAWIRYGERYSSEKRRRTLLRERERDVEKEEMVVERMSSRNFNCTDRTGFMEAFHQASVGYAHRDNGRIQFDSSSIASLIYERIKFLLPIEFEGLQPSSCSSNIRLYRYTVSQRFGKHIDESHDGIDGEKSVFTLLMYLNDDDLVGGETVFYKGNYGDRVAYSFPPKAGGALLHGHGSRCLLHEGKEVKHGAKFVLRTDVMYK